MDPLISEHIGTRVCSDMQNVRISEMLNHQKKNLSLAWLIPFDNEFRIASLTSIVSTLPFLLVEDTEPIASAIFSI